MVVVTVYIEHPAQTRRVMAKAVFKVRAQLFYVNGKLRVIAMSPYCISFHVVGRGLNGTQPGTCYEKLLLRYTGAYDQETTINEYKACFQYQ